LVSPNFESAPFEWDDDKAASNHTKHGVSFFESRTVFFDPRIVDNPDLDHSEDEPRRLAIGRSSFGRLLSVVYTERGDNIRIVSARTATRTERRRYEEG
jgi:uncharacterized DUF497 family protein